MKNLITFGVYVFLFMITSCGMPRIDEKHAAQIVKDELSLSGSVSAQKLAGGQGGSNLFLATDGVKKYVVRFIKNKPQKDWEREIYNLKVASKGGYGPEIYFADPTRGIVIMEYLPGKKVSEQDLQLDQFYVALARLLQKIHQGQAFLNSGYLDPFKRIEQDIQVHDQYGAYVPLARLERVINVICQAVEPYRTTAPCHNDLHGGNLIFLGNEFKAIDYEDAGPGDPFFDVATVLASTAFLSNPVHEKVLFVTYLGRQPSAVEAARLYLMEQVVLMKWACDSLNRLSLEDVQQYEFIQVPSIRDFAKENLEGKIDLSKPQDNIRNLKVLLNEVFSNFESPEFKNAVDLLQEQNSLKK